MTGRISLITAVLAAALAFAAPAWGDAWGADRSAATVRVSPDRDDNAARARQAALSSMLDARERTLIAARPTAVANPVRDDRFRLDPSSIRTPVATTTPGGDIEWPQIGIGFAIGVLLVVGLLLAIRMPRMRQPAH